MRSAVYWRWGSQVLGQLVTWTTTILVVRLLDPHDYGLFAMTQAVLAAFNFLNGYSFATSLIQAKEVDERRVSQVFGLLIVSNAILASAQLLSAPLAARYYGQPMVADMLRIQALVFLATPFIALPSALLARGLHFRSQALVNLGCALAGSSVALGLALSGYGVWALVWAPIAMFATRGLGLTIAAGGLVRPSFHFRGSLDIIGFGTALTICQLFWIIQSQSDILIAGRSFNPHDLGLYSEALFLTLIFTGRFLPSLNEVAFPAYAELANAGKPVGPAFVGGARLTMLMVATFFGPKWLEMIPIVAGLAIAMPAMALQIVCSPATNAIGRPGIYLRTSAAGAVIMPICFLFSIAHGPLGLVASWQVAAPLLLVFTLASTLPAIGVRISELLKGLMPAATGCGAMALMVLMLTQPTAVLSAPLRLALLAAAGAATYAATLFLLWPAVVRETLTMLRKPRASAPEPAGQTTTTRDANAG